ncbi:MAG: hypothetical protein ACK4UP_05245 [Spirosomataceae bacterium]
MRKKNKIDALRDSIRRDIQGVAAEDDMYSRFKKETSNVPAKETLAMKEEEEGEELDVPGAELDDQQEDIGSEDEENNYYSLGGDNHLDLEEN